MSNKHSESGDISYEYSQIKLVKDINLNMPSDRGYWKSNSKFGKKMGEKSSNMKAGESTEKYANSMKVQSKG